MGYNYPMDYLEALESPSHSITTGLYYPGSSIGVLLLHGFTSTPLVFTEFATLLSSLRYTVSAPLIAGHGSSPEHLEQTSWQDWYSSAERAYEELATHCSSIFIIGSSFGSNIACTLAARKPVQGLVLLGIPRWMYHHTLAYHITPLFRLLGMRFYHKQIAAKLKPEILHSQNHKVRSYDRLPLKSVQDFFHYIHHVSEAALPQITSPTLIIQSVNDGLIQPRSAQHIFERVGSSDKKISWITESHTRILSGNDKVDITNLVLDFLAKHSPSN